ncbi:MULTISPECIES: hypothetical protein [Microcoleaceae]|uniref:hypothetical protein n=1 Tax=Microcoleaceae TaxID=1892252 RepID=UPI002238B578|nr:hypothetical protein [Lyngbya sp. CCAP 1446/10]
MNNLDRSLEYRRFEISSSSDFNSSGIVRAHLSADPDLGHRNLGTDLNEHPHSSDILAEINSGKLLMVDSRRRNGLILIKRFHAEFAGPGAAVGGAFDVDSVRAIPVGDFCLVCPQSPEEKQKAFEIRRHWVRLTEQLTAKPVALERAQMILTQFEQYFDGETVAQIPDEALALLVGVFPQTIRAARQGNDEL